MNRHKWTLLLIGLILLVAIPVSAARPEPVGDRINIFASGSQTFDADTPFHITHGWTIDPAAGYPIGKFSFQLEVNGTPVDAEFVDVDYVRDEVEPLYRRWVHNFAGGMTGEAEFTGHWFAPCGYVLEYGNYPGPCPDLFEVVEAHTTVVQVTFGP